MLTEQLIYAEPLARVLDQYPYVKEMLISVKIPLTDSSMTVRGVIMTLPEEHFEDFGITRESLIEHIYAYLNGIEVLKSDKDLTLNSITIIGGHNKSGEPERIRFDIKPGEIISIVGPTGSGKSRLLADIECMAQSDTPTGRQVLINGVPPEEEQRYDMEHKLVAQLSQNMNFVMDLSVFDFITMHAQSRMAADEAGIARQIFVCANGLAGECFNEDTALTQLSGGQSRALMIASTALLSRSPIVLIDELENAGIDRKRALDLLVKNEKIVLMSTHDPILALMGQKRVIIKNGGIAKIFETSQEERENLKILKKYDQTISLLRRDIRDGERIDFDLTEMFALN